MNLRLLAPAALLLLGAASCSEDFDVVAPAKPITVVYGILNPYEPVQYVRIQRAFADPNRSALDVAKLPDSSYFTNLTVSLQEITGGRDTIVASNLPRVDLATENYPKDNGVFFTTPSYAYKITYPLKVDSRYRLLIKNNETGNVDTGETGLINLSPQVFSISDFNVSQTPDKVTELTPTNPSPSADKFYSWRVVQYPPTARYMDAVMRIWYEDVATSGARTRHYFDYRFTTVTRTGVASWGTAIPGALFNSFYEAIGTGMGAAPAGVTRLIDSADYLAFFGSDELYAYQQNQSALGGLTADQIQYRYTNLRGKNVIGLFASRSTAIRRQVPFSANTLQELKTNPSTAAAKITGVTPD